MATRKTAPTVRHEALTTLAEQAERDKRAHSAAIERLNIAQEDERLTRARAEASAESLEGLKRIWDGESVSAPEDESEAAAAASTSEVAE